MCAIISERKMYKLARKSEGVVRFAAEEVQAVGSLNDNPTCSCCPPGFYVTLVNGKGYKLPPEYYAEVRAMVGP